MDNCLFCKIASGAIPANIVYQDEQTVAFRDINPQAPTHILVIPRQHIASVAEATANDQALLGAVLLAANAVAKQEKLSSFRLVTNTGAEAGQSVFHLHVHVLGGRAMGWPPG